MTMGTSMAVSGSVVVAGDYNLVAFARDSGALRWRFVPGAGYGPGIYLGAAAAGLVYAGSPAGRLYAVDGESGAQRWSALVVADGPATVFQPIVDRDHVVAVFTAFSAPNRGGVAAYDRRSGGEKWRSAFPGRDGSDSSAASAGGPVAAGGLILAASADGVIYAFDRDNGRIRWSIPGIAAGRGPPPDGDFRPLAAIGRTLVAGSLTGCTSSYDLVTRQERWRYCDPTGASVAFAIGADERTVYAPYYEGRLVAIDLHSGRERWHIGGGAETGFNWLPAGDGSRLYVAGSTAGFFAFGRP
jgi:outer membrane protein assembly factor BamB